VEKLKSKCKNIEQKKKIEPDIQFLSKFTPEEVIETIVGYATETSPKKDTDSLTRILSKIDEQNYSSQKEPAWAICAQREEPNLLETDEEMNNLDADQLIQANQRTDFLETDPEIDNLDAGELDDGLPSELNDSLDQREIEMQVKQNQVQLALNILDTELVPAESMEIQKLNEQEKEINWLMKKIRQVDADIEEYRRWLRSGRIPISIPKNYKI